MAVIPELGRQEDCYEFVASLDYVWIHCLKTQDNKTEFVFRVNTDGNKQNWYFSTKAWVLNPYVSKETQVYFSIAKFIVLSIINKEPQLIELNEKKIFKSLLKESNKVDKLLEAIKVYLPTQLEEWGLTEQIYEPVSHPW